MELILESPRVKHPSVVACAPDGRVFIAEDPMDISLPNANAAEGRILCLHTNGQATVFAEKLYAVFGLQYLEGKLYVLHNPNFSVFDDDNGVGRNRRELIEQTLPNPSALNWNDHVPANFRLAMDGYFYVACGDKGLYRAQGTDGSLATLSSGGVFRIRPDGSGLEVFCHGARNILDVAMNAEDEIFTYDNTDEHDWMGRFTHMVEAGFYGYPHDFIPRRPYTLWMMEDYGAGAACGAFAYNEDALPEEYRGNIFMADFGKRQVMRVQVERAGGTYRAASKEDLFPNPPGDFRPVGITLGPDGKSIYICDWQHRDEKARVSVGRLWKLTWTGRDHSAPKPTWYLPAAMGRSEEWSLDELVRGLSHASHKVRLTAQRVLARMEKDAPEKKSLLTSPPTMRVAKLLRDRKAESQARVHAIWALHEINKGQGAREEIISLVSNEDALLRRQAIRQLGATRDVDAVNLLLEKLKDEDASVRFHAATALGRIGDARAVPGLFEALDEQDLFARFAMFTALNRTGTNSAAAWPSIVRGLESANEQIRDGTRFALRETYNRVLLDALVELFRDSARGFSARRAALELIVALHHRKPEWKGEWWAYHPALQPPPRKTERWAGTETVLATLRAGLREENADLRRMCIDGLVAAGDTNSAAALREIYPNESAETQAVILRALGRMKNRNIAMPLVMEELKRGRGGELTLSAVRAAGELGGNDAMMALGAYVRSADAPPPARAEAITVMANLGANSITIASLRTNEAPIVRAAAVLALGRLEGTNALPSLEAALADQALDVRRAAVKALDGLRSELAVPALLKAHSDDELQNDAFFALARQPDPGALEALLDGLDSKNSAHRNAAHLAIRNMRGRVLEHIEGKAHALSALAITELRQIYAGDPRAEAGAIFARDVQQHTPEEYLAAALERNGDAERGRTLFNNPAGVNCAACHRVGATGSDLGPDLTNIGAQFDRRALAESILFPSKALREGYQQIMIETRDEEALSGIVRGEDADAVTLRDSAGREHRIAREAITGRRNSSLSLMPEGLHSALSLEEFADLIAYLEGLKSR